MTRPSLARERRLLAVSLALAALGLAHAGSARGQDAPRDAQLATRPGRFFTIEEPIEGIKDLQSAARALIDRAAARGQEPVLIFEIRTGSAAPGATTFGAAKDLADFLSTKLGGAGRTVAYIPEPLSGYAVLAALACDEIVMGRGASLGPITPEGEPVDPTAAAYVRLLANRKGRDNPDLWLGMLDRDADLRRVRTADRQVHFVLAEHLDDFRRERGEIVENEPAWEGARRGVLTAEQARGSISRMTAEGRAEVAHAYGLAGQAASDDPTLGQVLNPVWIRIAGPIDAVQESYLVRRIQQARQDRVNLIFFEINSEGGQSKAADTVADAIANLRGMKTVAYVDDRAMGLATLVVLACDEIVVAEGARMGDVSRVVTGSGGRSRELDADELLAVANRAADLAERNGHPAALARAMVDPAAVVYEATDTKTGAAGFVTEEQMQEEPGRYANPRTVKEEGTVLTLSAEDAVGLGLAHAAVADDAAVKDLYGLRGKAVRVDQPGWVDTVITILNTTWMSYLLLFVGLFMLILELKLPGIGLPAITSALAFLLFFWSRYLSGTANQLEILLFLVGLICLALELFVFPGMGVFGMSGILLILISVVMASHTFIWPTEEYQYREMGQTLLQVTLIIVGVAAGAVMVGKYFPSLPVFNRMVLKPEPWDAAATLAEPTAKPSAPEGDDSLFYLLGETGRTTTVLRPTGKARFGERLVDVTADGFFIEPDSLVEVVEVRGSRVLVKRVV